MKIVTTILVTTVVFLAFGINTQLSGQYEVWQDSMENSLTQFDLNCTTKSIFESKLNVSDIKKTVETENLDLQDMPFLALEFPLKGKEQFAYFVPISCGGTGNCTYLVVTRDPYKFLGTITGQYLYLYSSVEVWPTIITYGHLSAAEGVLHTYKFKNGKYDEVGDGWPIGREGTFLPIQEVEANEMPDFLTQAKKGCEKLGW